MLPNGRHICALILFTSILELFASQVKMLKENSEDLFKIFIISKISKTLAQYSRNGGAKKRVKIAILIRTAIKEEKFLGNLDTTCMQHGTIHHLNSGRL